MKKGQKYQSELRYPTFFFFEQITVMERLYDNDSYR